MKEKSENYHVVTTGHHMGYIEIDTTKEGLQEIITSDPEKKVTIQSFLGGKIETTIGTCIVVQQGQKILQMFGPDTTRDSLANNDENNKS